MICHGLGLTFLFVGFARDFMVFMTEISFRISFYQPKCLSTNISMSAVIIILNKVIYIRTYLKPLEIINLGRDHPWSGVRTLDRPSCNGFMLAGRHQRRVPILWSKLILGIFKPFGPRIGCPRTCPRNGNFAIFSTAKQLYGWYFWDSFIW